MPSYIDVPISTDSDALAQEAFAYLMANIPGYVPAPGNLESFLVEALARMVNEARIVASQVPARVFAFFGKSLLGLPAIDATKAQTTATWTFTDNAGYTVPAGTHVAFKTAGDQLVMFQTVAPFTVAPGSTATAAGAVTVQAVVAGAAASGIVAGSMVLIDSIASVASVVSTATSSGGLDAESDADYLDRLASELQLLTPRPILPAEFATLARNVAGVYRATAIDMYWAGRVFADGATTNLSPTLTSPALGAFTQDDVGRTVAGTGVPGGTTILSVASSTSATMSANATATNSGVSITLGALTTAPRAVTLAAVDSTGTAVGAPVKTALAAYLAAQREVNFVVNTIDPQSTAVAVAFTFKTANGYVGSAVKAAAEAAVLSYLSPAHWGGGDQTPPTWTNDTTVRYLEVATIINNVPGVAYTSALTLNGGTVNVTLAGVAALPNPTAVGTAS